MPKEALLYKQLKNSFVNCYLCGHQCKIAVGKFGFCGVRQNIDGKLYTHTYGNVVARNIDPIEKKPLYHFLPGTNSYSIATFGCNFRCGFCQNWQISQQRFDSAQLPASQQYSPQEIVSAALANNCRSISYTYTEPTIYLEYALDVAKLAKEKGLANIFVTNGFMSQDAIKLMEPYIDAANIDLKFFQESSYKKVCSGDLKPVLESIKKMYERGIWLEITTLIVPKLNDSESEMRSIAKFIAKIDKNIPWHISRFFPNYKFNLIDPTAEDILQKGYQIGQQAGLKYVYVGNVYGWGNDTYCHNCKKLLIKREGFAVREINVVGGMCTSCHSAIPGRF